MKSKPDDLTRRLKITATSDVNPASLERLCSELQPDLDLSLDERSIFLKSAEPPSWIQFVALAPWWIKALGAYAALYVAEIVKEAGKETWKKRAEIARAAAGAGNKILKFARSLVALRERISPRTKFVFGLPVPDDYPGTRLELTGKDESTIAAEIALFVSYLPAIERLIEAEGLQGKVAFGMTLRIAGDSSLRVAWMIPDSSKTEERTLRLDDEPLARAPN